MLSIYAGLCSCLLNILIIPFIIKFANKKKLYDTVDERKIHTGNIPRLAGIGIFSSFIITICLFVLIDNNLKSFALMYLPIAIAMLLVHLTGLLDDLKDLRALLKFFVHVIAAVIVCCAGFRFQYIYVPFFGIINIDILSWPLTIFWIVGVINAINMIDGMDGLSGGITIIASIAFGVIFFNTNQLIPFSTAIIIIGSLVGYLVYNFPPAKTFMGDSGSNFIGFLLAVFPLLDKTANNGMWFWDGVTILLLPIFDVFAAIIRRGKKHKFVMSPDKWHIHHKLLRFGFSTKKVLLIIYTICMILGMSSITVLFVSKEIHFAIIMVTWFVLLCYFFYIHIVKEKKLASKEIKDN